MKTLKELQRQFLSHTYYKGIQTCKNPMDLWVYQEIIQEVKPDVIIEIGVWKGGTTLWLANCIGLDRLYSERALLIGIDKTYCKFGYEINFVHNDCLQSYEEVIKTIHNNLRRNPDKCDFEELIIMIIEDSSHTYENTLECLKLYSPLVSVGSYYIVEDTIAPQLGYDLRPDLAVKEFLKDNDSFVVDETREKYITWNPGGFLKRVK